MTASFPSDPSQTSDEQHHDQAPQPEPEPAQTEQPEPEPAEPSPDTQPADAASDTQAAEEAGAASGGEAAATEQDQTGQAEAAAAEGEPKPGKRKKRTAKSGQQQPTVQDVVRRVGTSTERALQYVDKPDPRLARLPRKVRESLLPNLPAVTAAALLGPAALARHLVASAAAGRYRDLFALWELFRRYPEECKPVLAERGAALQRARARLRTAVRIGLTGRGDWLSEDVARAEGLIWQWMRELLVVAPAAVAARPAIASALLEREPEHELPLPDHPEERWLAEAAATRLRGTLAPPIEQRLAANLHRLPATAETLRLATRHYPDTVPGLVDRVDLDAPDVGAFLAWARDHDAADRLYGRIRDRVSAMTAKDPAEGLAEWHRWTQRGVPLVLPETLRNLDFDELDLSRPETAALAAHRVAEGVTLNLQARLEELAQRNRLLAEKAYEALVCADLDVQLPATLENNPAVKAETRCVKCRAWTWVRPGHEDRCPRPVPPPTADPFELAAQGLAREQP